MLESIAQIWSRSPVGFRRGELEEGDGLGTMVVALIGGPALVVGGLLASDGLSLIQVALLAPLAAILGGVLVGASARMAASTGATGAWLLRPTFGLFGSWFISLLRLVMVGLWTVIGLQMAGRWGDSVLDSVGLSLGVTVVTVILVALALVMTLWGPIAMIRYVVRRPLLWASVVLLGVTAWQITTSGVGGSGQGGLFWVGLQRAVEMAAVFVPLAQTIGRRLRDDEDAVTSFGVGYTVPATVMLIGGAVFAHLTGGMPSVAGIDPMVFGVGLAAAWVLIGEVDQVFWGFIAAGAEASGVVYAGASVLVGIGAAVGIGVAAVLLPEVPLAWAELATALVFPAVLIAAADYFLARSRHYSESEIYGLAAGESLVNVVGLVTWLLAVILGQALDPVGPAAFVDLMPVGAADPDVPWRLLMAVVAAIGYVVLARWRTHRAATRFDLRGV